MLVAMPNMDHVEEKYQERAAKCLTMWHKMKPLTVEKGIGHDLAVFNIDYRQAIFPLLDYPDKVAGPDEIEGDKQLAICIKGLEKFTMPGIKKNPVVAAVRHVYAFLFRIDKKRRWLMHDQPTSRNLLLHNKLKNPEGRRLPLLQGTHKRQ